MSDLEFRLKELERRMGRVEDATVAIPVIQRDVAEIKQDVLEVRNETRTLAAENRDETRSLRRGFYTLAFSVMGGSILFSVSVFEIFK